MLLKLTILDLAVVKSLNLDLQHGMSILTGETGAGKSILLTALGLALGNRADSGFIRPGSKRAEINLEFDLSDAPLAQQWLIDNDLDSEQECLIRRTISDDGRSKAYINGRSVTLQSLQDLSEKLIEIHGQHAYLTLLNPDEQRRLLDNYSKNQQQLLDSFAKNQPLIEQVNQQFQRWQQANQELEQLVKSSNARDERQALLEYQLEELQNLDLKHFNYAELSEEHSKLANLGEILGVGQQQLDLLTDNDQQSLNQSLSQSIHELQGVARYAPELTAISAQLADAQIQLEEAAQELRRYLEAQEADPMRLDFLETQIGVIHNLSRKHQVSAESLPELAKAMQQELSSLTHNAERIDELSAEVKAIAQTYQQLAQQLSAKRSQSGLELQRHISAMIKELGMSQGEFIVSLSSLSDNKPRLNGLDKIEFLVSANPGLPPKPLAKVASGGELSRISLAIQVVTSNDKTTPTMIFDEVDSGIGGGIAEIVGQKLRSLSHNRQVLCVTHLPQVAAQAHHHLYVAKNNQSDITSSTVRLLDTEERIEEVARMLGGVNITANTIAHA
ncbi:MAG: DNA repair protein RecN, partial [Methylococcaceae bacterium]|nr:DNA repair protein RecN [Methylococcaceae bacterium]